MLRQLLLLSLVLVTHTYKINPDANVTGSYMKGTGSNEHSAESISDDPADSRFDPPKRACKSIGYVCCRLPENRNTLISRTSDSSSMSDNSNSTSEMELCRTKENARGVCVIYFLCSENGSIIIDGAGLIDSRSVPW